MNKRLKARCYKALELFVPAARAICGKEGVAITMDNIRFWQAYDDPAWQEAVLDLTLDTGAETAMRLWDIMSEQLDINTVDDKVRYAIGLCIHWERRDDGQ